MDFATITQKGAKNYTGTTLTTSTCFLNGKVTTFLRQPGKPTWRFGSWASKTTLLVQLQNASNIKGRMMPQRCCMPICCIFSEPNWNKSISTRSACISGQVVMHLFGHLCMMQGNRPFPRDRSREKILGNRWFCDLSLWVLNFRFRKHQSFQT